MEVNSKDTDQALDVHIHIIINCGGLYIYTYSDYFT